MKTAMFRYSAGCLRSGSYPAVYLCLYRCPPDSRAAETFFSQFFTQGC